MSDILISQVRFVDVAAGAQAVLPHTLNVKGRPEVPDELKVDNGAFTADADAVNVTVTNGSAAAASVSVLCEMWHSIPRVFGLQNQDVQDSLPVRPFVGAGAGSNVVGSDELVGVSADDTTPNYLDAKIVAGPGISLAILNPTGDEQMRVTATGTSAESASAFDDTPVSTSSTAYVPAFGAGGGATVPSDGDYYASWEGEIENSSGAVTADVGISVNSDVFIIANSERTSQGPAADMRPFTTSTILAGLVAGDKVSGLLRRGTDVGASSVTLLARRITIIKIN